MNPNVKFIFDPRGLPRELSTPAQRDQFVKAVTDEVEKFGVNINNATVKNNIAVTIGTLIKVGKVDTRRADFAEAVYDAYKVSLDRYRPEDPSDQSRNQDLYDMIVSVLAGVAHSPLSAAAIGAADAANATAVPPPVEIAFQEIAFIAHNVIANPNRYPLTNGLIANQINVARDRYVEGAPPADTLELPPLTGTTGELVEFEGPNIEAVGLCYLGMQLDRMGLVAVVDRMSELNQLGLLTLRYGTASKALDDWHWSAEDRLNQPSRMSVYGRVCGMPGALISKEVRPNEALEPAITRLVSCIVESDRQERVATLIEPGRLRSLQLTDEAIRKTARDAASIASVYGWSGTQFQARLIKTTMLEALRILSLPEILSLYAATSPYQVIERVSSEEFKHMPNVVKLRTIAEAGHALLRLIAANLHAWGPSPTRPLFETVDPQTGQGRGDGDLSIATRREFLLHANSFAAVSGMNDAQISQGSQPVDVPYLPSMPQLGGGVAPLPAAGGDDTLNKLRQLMASGTMPSQDQLKSLLSMN